MVFDAAGERLFISRDVEMMVLRRLVLFADVLALDLDVLIEVRRR